MGAGFDDAALLHDQDAVGVSDRIETMGDDDGGAADEQAIQGILDEAFALGVEVGGGLVEDEQGRVRQHGPGDGDALTLTAGELPPVRRRRCRVFLPRVR